MDLNACGHRASTLNPAVGGPSSSSAEPHTGTTIVACRYKGGVVLGADGRVSTGNYISNRASNKITRLTDNVYLLRSGSAADTQAVGDYGACKPWFPPHIFHAAGPCVWQHILTPCLQAACIRCVQHCTQRCVAVSVQHSTACPACSSMIHAVKCMCAAAAPAVRYFAEQLTGELGHDPSVRTVANLVAQVCVCGHV